MSLRSFQRIYGTMRISSLYLQNISCILPKFKHGTLARNCHVISCYQDKDPAPYFFDNKIQSILKKLTGQNIEKIFKERHLELFKTKEEYKFLTKEDFEEEVAKSMKEAKRLLTMPPVLRERQPITEILSYDPALQGALNAKTIFTDISFGVSNRDRIIVVRDTDGTLRQASWEERDRMNQIYEPRRGKYHRIPELFQDQNLKDALDREEYLFVLNFACVQFEPDDPMFHKVTAETYEHVRKTSSFETLHSTRHFGPMCFYFAWNKTIDKLLLHYIYEERINDAIDLIQLEYLIHNKEKAFQGNLGREEQEAFLSKYIEEDSNLKSNLELAFSMYKETLREREKFKEDVKKSHGIS